MSTAAAEPETALPDSATRSPGGLVAAAAGFVVAVVASSVALAVVIAVRDLPTDITSEDLDLGYVLLVQSGLWLGLVAAPLLWARRHEGPVAELGLRFTRADAGKGLVIGIGAQFLLVPLYWPLFELFDFDTDDLAEVAEGLGDRVDGLATGLALVLITVVGAPIAEELFYRGLVQRSLRRRLPAWSAIGVASIVFAVSHFQVLQFPALLLIGVILGVLAERSGRLGPAIWGHVGFNLVTTVGLLA